MKLRGMQNKVRERERDGGCAYTMHKRSRGRISALTIILRKLSVMRERIYKRVRCGASVPAATWGGAWKNKLNAAAGGRRCRGRRGQSLDSSRASLALALPSPCPRPARQNRRPSNTRLAPRPRERWTAYHFVFTPGLIYTTIWPFLRGCSHAFSTPPLLSLHPHPHLHP
jgi:hypothetical protein